MGSATGIDSLEPSSAAILTNAIGPDFLGVKPDFWGQYLHNTGQRNSSGDVDPGHYSARENAFLRQNGIRLMPIARQTSLFGGSRAFGAQHAQFNVDAIFEALSSTYLAAADPNVLVYLDIEQSHPVSKDYYSAWAETLIAYSQTQSAGKVTLLPAVYINAQGAEPGLGKYSVRRSWRRSLQWRMGCALLFRETNPTSVDDNLVMPLSGNSNPNSSVAILG